jgi:hypothetical protein
VADGADRAEVLGASSVALAAKAIITSRSLAATPRAPAFSRALRSTAALPFPCALHSKRAVTARSSNCRKTSYGMGESTPTVRAGVKPDYCSRLFIITHATIA